MTRVRGENDKKRRGGSTPSDVADVAVFYLHIKMLNRPTFVRERPRRG